MRSISSTVSTFGASATAACAFCGTSVLGKPFSVTTTLAFVSRRMEPICSASSSGLIGVRDPRDGRTDESDRRLVAVGQDVGDHVAFPDAEAAEEVRSLGRLRVELAPRQGLGLVRGSGHDLEGDRVSVTMRPRGARQELVERRGHSAAVPCPRAFDLADIVDRRETAHAFLPVTPAFAPMCFDGARMGNSARVASRDRPGNATSGPYSAAMPSVNWSRARRA